MAADSASQKCGERILLGHLAARGDCLYATAIAHQIKHDFPNCHLTWAIGSMCRDILRGNPYVDEIWEFPVANHGEVAGAWREFVRQASERERQGDFDRVYFTQVYPDNFRRFDGTVRMSVFRGYPGKVTVPVAPVLRLGETETAHVKSFVERHGLEQYRNVILFECASHSGQSFVTPDFALEVATKLVRHRTDVAVVLSSSSAIESQLPAIVDGSELTFLENAELSKYCDLLVGCSSGISWVCTSDWAKRLPTVQLLRKDTSVFASMAHDFEYRGEPSTHIIEMTDSPVERVVLCVEMVVDEGIVSAREKFHEQIPLDFRFYSQIICSQLGPSRLGEVMESLWHTTRRYGPRYGMYKTVLAGLYREWRDRRQKAAAGSA